MSELANIASSSGLGKNGASRAAQGPVPVHSHPPSGVRTPTDIMRQRRDREARRKAEQEAKDREDEETERRRQQEQERQAQAQAQPYAAGVAGDTSSQRRPAMSRGPVGPGMQHDGGTGTGVPQTQVGGPQTQPMPMPASSFNQQVPPQQPSQPARFQGAPTTGPQTGQNTSQKPQGQAAPPSQANAPQPQQQPRRVAFPHAFERWETLSSHWEGLTGYWIRKLEQNNEALDRDPLSQQMARQITDLSAAGANLFHAVVELQRLRASSERKFQRWFFDTRAEQERAKELQADLERQLKAERQARAEAVASVQKAESDKTRTEDLLKEMRRELQISKEEARRAWEELGRREQEERDRTNSLRNGEPTLVGGVQVVPMIQGLPSRPTTMNRPSGGPASTTRGASPTETDPFTEGTKPNVPTFGISPPRQQPATTASESQGQYDGHFYQHEGPGLYPAAPTSEPDDRSYGPSVASSEPGEEEYGNYRRDAQGRQNVYAPALSEESDEYDAEDRGHYVSGSEFVPGSTASTSAPLYAGYSQGNVDYSGSGWGVGTGWEAVTPRHRHPTRLSDVLEEDEPSRTSPSRASQASRSIQ